MRQRIVGSNPTLSARFTPPASHASLPDMTSSAHSPSSQPEHIRHVVALLGELVALDTSQPRPTRPVMDFVEKQLRAAGAVCQVAVGEKGAVFATIGPAEAPGGVILSAHADVVAVRGQKMANAAL